MIVKDAEAPEYECPQAIISDSYVYCRGSRCMAWRWADEDWSDPENVKMLEPHTHGYCGLAGRP